ncbi:MAG: hypothetical protein ACFE89_05575 [Candidatus Hodarchaeota archaeon]
MSSHQKNSCLTAFAVHSHDRIYIKADNAQRHGKDTGNNPHHYTNKLAGGNVTLDTGLFIAIAEIAGVFVGFGALISLIRPDEVEATQLARIRGLVTVGLTIIIAALIPIAINLYGVSDHPLWLISSLIFYSLNWFVMILSFRDPVNRELMKTQTKTSPIISVLFWALLEVPLHFLLILTILGLFPHLDLAFYTTALLFFLFEAAFALVQVVHSQTEPQSKPASKPDLKL